MKDNTVRYPTLPQAWVIFLIFIAASIGLGISMGVINESTKSDIISIGNFFAYNISMLFVIWFAWRNARQTTPELPVFYVNKIPALSYLLLIFLTLSFAVVLDPLTNLLPMPEFVKELFAMLGTKDIWTLLMVCITGPILEEVLFRGIIMEGFLSRYKPFKAIFWSAFLFGLFHLNPWQFIPAFLIGGILGYIYLKTRSLIPVILVHVVNNSFSYILLYFFGADVYSFRDILPAGNDYMILIWASVLVFILVSLILYQLLKRNSDPWTFISKESNSS